MGEGKRGRRGRGEEDEKRELGGGREEDGERE